jgi:hypothetical protein
MLAALEKGRMYDAIPQGLSFLFDPHDLKSMVRDTLHNTPKDTAGSLYLQTKGVPVGLNDV